MTSKQENYAKVLNAIKAGLVFADEKDEDDFLVLVDENRELDDFTPSKTLVGEMENEKLIEAIEKETKRDYIQFGSEKVPIPLIAIYVITDKGEALL